MGVLDGRAVVITGAGRGLGEAYARHAGGEGARVVVNDVDAAAAERVAASIRAAGGEAVPAPADVSLQPEAAGLVELCVRRYGAIDGLINNAGVAPLGLPEEITEAEARRVFGVNVLGTVFTGVAALRRMLDQGRGAIVNVTSGAQAGLARMSLYAMSKGAVASLTYSWAMDMAGRGIRVNAISPMAATLIGAGAADYYAARGEPPPEPAGGMPDPADNAAVATFLLSDAAAGLHGQVVRIDGTRLSLMTHPAVLHPPLSRDSWDLAAVTEAFATGLAEQAQPLGVAALEVTGRPYRLPYLP